MNGCLQCCGTGFDNQVDRMEEPTLSLTVSGSEVHTGDWLSWSNRTEHSGLTSLVGCPAQRVERPRTSVKELFVYHSKFYTMSIKIKKERKRKAVLQSQSAAPNLERRARFLLKVAVVAGTTEMLWRDHSLNVVRIREFKSNLRKNIQIILRSFVL